MALRQAASQCQEYARLLILQERLGRKWSQAIRSQGPLPVTYFPQWGFHERALAAGNQGLKNMSLKNIFHIQTTMVSFWIMFKFHTGLSDRLDREDSYIFPKWPPLIVTMTSLLSFSPSSLCHEHHQLNRPYLMRLTEEKKRQKKKTLENRASETETLTFTNPWEFTGVSEPWGCLLQRGYQGHGCSLNRCLYAGILNLIVLEGVLFGGNGTLMNGRN